jgi:hypothetical protein
MSCIPVTVCVRTPHNCCDETRTRRGRGPGGVCTVWRCIAHHDLGALAPQRRANVRRRLLRGDVSEQKVHTGQWRHRLQVNRHNRRSASGGRIRRGSSSSSSGGGSGSKSRRGSGREFAVSCLWMRCYCSGSGCSGHWGWGCDGDALQTMTKHLTPATRCSAEVDGTGHTFTLNKKRPLRRKPEQQAARNG